MKNRIGEKVIIEGLKICDVGGERNRKEVPNRIRASQNLQESVVIGVECVM